ncbi:MAG TPA: 50S ribosomal protein L32 [Chloroflexi bacterium]|nr:MAG: 50S ribosomal protein L32 [Anaerolineaceae bacterium 4572_5.2]HEY85672.1 50S ribosomal protein L32 [Chloroflexota bacterium]
MGALPKRRISSTRQARKRAHYLRIKMPHLLRCPQCGSLRRAHSVCPTCGTYKGVEILEIDDSAKK